MFERKRTSDSTPYAVIQRKVMDNPNSLNRISPNPSRSTLVPESPYVKSPLHASVDQPQKVQSASHKDYLKNMLINKFTKKYPGETQRRMIEIEVNSSMANEYMTKDNLKALEAKIVRRLNPPKSILTKRAKQSESVTLKNQAEIESKRSFILAGKKHMRNNR